MPARTAFILALLSAPCRGSEPAAQAASVVRRRPFLAQVASRRDAHGGSAFGAAFTAARTDPGVFTNDN
jgi:hypothetical protein